MFLEESYLDMQKKIRRSMDCLRAHENKEYGVIGRPLKKYTLLPGFNLHGYYSNPFFKDFLDQLLFEIQLSSPDLFGVGNPEAILSEIHKITQEKGNYLGSDFETFVSGTLKEGFLLVTDSPSTKILRLDLYRTIEKGEFIGGLLHAFKHFTKNGIPLSAQKGETISLPDDIIDKIIEAFYKGTLNPDTSKNGGGTYKIKYEYSDESIFEFVFYHQKECDIYFLTTMRRISNRKSV